MAQCPLNLVMRSAWCWPHPLAKRGFDMYQTHLTLKSRNKKTGAMPVTTTTAKTCPKTCPFNHRNEGGCYADGGPLGMFWQKVTDGRAGADYSETLQAVADLPAETIWRHNQAGDLFGDGRKLDRRACYELADANTGKRGFTFTHYLPEVADNAATIAELNRRGFTVNLSANNAADADRLAGFNCGPVAAVMPEEYGRRNKGGEYTETLAEYKARIKPLVKTTPAGRPVTICPATFLENMNCKKCGLCQKRDRAAVVGFPAHGRAKKRADNIAQGGAENV